MQKVNVDVHIWNELRSNDRFGFKHVVFCNLLQNYCVKLLKLVSVKKKMQKKCKFMQD